MRGAIFLRSCGSKKLSRHVVAGSITHLIIRQQKQVSGTAVLPTQNPKLKLVFCAMRCAILIRPVLEPDFAWQNIETTHWMCYQITVAPKNTYLPILNPKLKLIFWAIRRVILCRPILEQDLAGQKILRTHGRSKNLSPKKCSPKKQVSTIAVFPNPKP